MFLAVRHAIFSSQRSELQGCLSKSGNSTHTNPLELPQGSPDIVACSGRPDKLLKLCCGWRPRKQPPTDDNRGRRAHAESIAYRDAGVHNCGSARTPYARAVPFRHPQATRGEYSLNARSSKRVLGVKECIVEQSTL